MLSDLFDTLSQFFVKVINIFPHTNISFDSYIETLDDILPYINWFIPFYHLEPIIKEFIRIFFIALGALLITRFIVSKFKK